MQVASIKAIKARQTRSFQSQVGAGDSAPLPRGPLPTGGHQGRLQRRPGDQGETRYIDERNIRDALQT